MGNWGTNPIYSAREKVKTLHISSTN
jgi:hypothetical protein